MGLSPFGWANQFCKSGYPRFLGIVIGVTGIYPGDTIGGWTVIIKISRMKMHVDNG